MNAAVINQLIQALMFPYISQKIPIMGPGDSPGDVTTQRTDADGKRRRTVKASPSKRVDPQRFKGSGRATRSTVGSTVMDIPTNAKQIRDSTLISSHPLGVWRYRFGDISTRQVEQKARFFSLKHLAPDGANHAPGHLELAGLGGPDHLHWAADALPERVKECGVARCCRGSQCLGPQYRPRLWR